MRARRPPGRIAESERSTDLEAAREAALRLLERTRRTRADLARRLRDKGYAAATVEQALDRLTGVGLVDDAEYARAYLAGRRQRRPAGKRRLEQELRARGVAAGDVASAQQRLDQEQGGVDELAGARRVVAQAERRTRGLDPRARRQRLYALLARRGFDPEVIRTVLDPGGEEFESE
ncbi:MAG: RecX family transcriptional regulator [Candidatus Eisenbacteria bacterium]|nr:RecX family transcriptional regulator [Candidatus Eisenbacteria bacterium]